MILNKSAAKKVHRLLSAKRSANVCSLDSGKFGPPKKLGVVLSVIVIGARGNNQGHERGTLDERFWCEGEMFQVVPKRREGRSFHLPVQYESEVQVKIGERTRRMAQDDARVDVAKT